MLKTIHKLNWQHVLVLVFLLAMFLMPYFVFAQTSNGQGTAKNLLIVLSEKAGFATGPQNSIGNVVALVINAILSLVGVIFLAQMIYGGYLWMTARGNDEQVEKARNLIQQSIIGIIIMIAAYAIVYFVLSNLIGPGSGGSGSGGNAF